MINTSTEYKKAIQKDREFRIQDTITFKDGTKQGKTITLSTGDFMSYSINGATSSSGKFDIGAAVIKKYTAVLNNMDNKFSEYDFEGADIRSYIGLKLEDGSWEVLSKGTYRVCKARSKDLTISIEAYDYMLFFDQPYSKSKLSYPATINEIIADACLSCQMTYNAQTIQNGRFTVEKRPEDEALTFRDIISYCAQIMCCYARISNTNALEFGWYDFSIFDRNDNVLDGGDFYDYTGSNADGGNFKDYTGDIKDGGSFTDQRDFHHLYLLGSQDIDVADIVITGVKATADNSSDDNNDKTESYLYGTEDYALSLEGNPLIQGGHTEEVARYVGPRIVGRHFRPLSITCLSDPSIEEGDVAYVTDRKNNTYKTVITNTTFSMGGYQSVICDAETKTENNYTRYGAETKLLAQAKKDIQNQISQYDLVVQQFGTLMANGMGLYRTTEEKNGALIYYMHDKPLLEDSKTIWKMTEGAFSVSTNGGIKWNAGVDKEGNILAAVLTVLKVNADWIYAGTLTLGGKDHKNGTLELLDTNGNTITTLTENGLDVLKGSIKGSTITLGGSNNVDGALTVKNSTGEVVATINNSGVDVKKGSIQGSIIIGNTITLGGINDTDGSLLLKDSNGKKVASLNNTGMDLLTGRVGGWNILKTRITNGIPDMENANFFGLINENKKPWIYASDNNGEETFSISRNGSVNLSGVLSSKYKRPDGWIEGVCIKNGKIYGDANERIDSYTPVLNLHDTDGGLSALVSLNMNGSNFVIRQYNTDIVWFSSTGTDFKQDVYYKGSGIHSDKRLKKNIKEVDFKALDILEKIKINSFDWKDDGMHVYSGVIAQDVRNIASWLVKEDDNGFLAVKETELVTVLLKAIQEEKKKREMLEEVVSKIICERESK